MHHRHPFDSTIFMVSSFSLANPAAGANFIYPVPANVRMEILGVTLTYTSDANVATRLMQIHAFDGTSPLQYAQATASQTASLTGYYSASSSGASIHTAATDSVYCMILPSPMILNTGDSLRSTICLIQATDQISAIRIRAKVWINPY